MARETPCQTDGAVFSVLIDRDHIEAWVDLPMDLRLDEGDAAVLDANIHNALEMVLAPYFREPRLRAVGWLKGDEIRAGCPDLSVGEFETVFVREDS